MSDRRDYDDPTGADADLPFSPAPRPLSRVEALGALHSALRQYRENTEDLRVCRHFVTSERLSAAVYIEHDGHVKRVAAAVEALDAALAAEEKKGEGHAV